MVVYVTKDYPEKVQYRRLTLKQKCLHKDESQTQYGNLEPDETYLR